MIPVQISITVQSNIIMWNGYHSKYSVQCFTNRDRLSMGSINVFQLSESLWWGGGGG